MGKTFDAAGFTVDRCIEITANVAMGNWDGPRKARNQLRSIDLRFRLTGAYTSTNAVTLQIRGRLDEFDEKQRLEE